MEALGEGTAEQRFTLHPSAKEIVTQGMLAIVDALVEGMAEERFIPHSSADKIFTQEISSETGSSTPAAVVDDGALAHGHDPTSPSLSWSEQDGQPLSIPAPEGTTEHPARSEVGHTGPLQSSTGSGLESKFPPLEPTYLSKEDAMHLVTKACAQSNVDVLEFLARCGLSQSVVSECSLSVEDARCAQVLHERFGFVFTEDMLFQACLSSRTDLAAYMVGLPKNPPSLSSPERAKQLLVSAARRNDSELVNVIMRASEQGVLQDDLIAFADELFAIFVADGDVDPMAKLEGWAVLLQLFVQRGAKILDSFTKLSGDDENSPQNKRKQALLQRYLQSHVTQTYTDNALVAPWSKLNLHSCSESFFTVDSQPMPLVEVDLSHNCLTGMPSTLFDGTLPTLEKVALNDNELSTLCVDREKDIDFSNSR